jgi:hypothetical protein
LTSRDNYPTGSELFEQVMSRVKWKDSR